MRSEANVAVRGAGPTGGSDAPEAPEPGGALAPATVMIAIGVCCVVLGGLVAAMTDPLDLARGSWLAAYLVLVAGVAQCAMGQARSQGPNAAQALLWGWAHIVAWNVGNAVVIGGTFVGVPLVVDLGSMLLVTALAIALHAARPGTNSVARSIAGRAPSLSGWAYRVLLLVLIVSVPVGMTFAHLQQS